MKAIKYETRRDVTVRHTVALPPFVQSRLLLSPTEAAFCLGLSTRQVDRLRKADRGFPEPLETKSGCLLFHFLELKAWATQHSRTFNTPF